jgi:hypothetical protein
MFTSFDLKYVLDVFGFLSQHCFTAPVNASDVKREDQICSLCIGDGQMVWRYSYRFYAIGILGKYTDAYEKK